MQRRVWSLFLGAAALSLTAISPGMAQTRVGAPKVVFIPTSKAPQLPQGLQLGCVKASNNGAPTSDTCPVVQYQGVNTWIFSYNDNRMSFALASYHESGKLLRAVEKPGARYIFDALPSERSGLVVLVGQAQQTVTVPLDAFGRGNVQAK